MRMTQPQSVVVATLELHAQNIDAGTRRPRAAGQAVSAPSPSPSAAVRGHELVRVPVRVRVPLTCDACAAEAERAASHAAAALARGDARAVVCVAVVHPAVVHAVASAARAAPASPEAEFWWRAVLAATRAHGAVEPLRHHACTPAARAWPRTTWHGWAFANVASRGGDGSSRRRARVDIVLVYAPTLPSGAPAPCTGPDTAWSSRLARLDNARRRLGTANAYISTLGGGHFLCRHLSAAVRLAAAQMAVAAALGDARLRAHAAVHVVYCLVQAGRFRAATRLTRALVRHAHAALGGDAALLAMCAAAARYARRTHALWAAGTLAATRPATPAAAASDEYYRQRLVSIDA